MKNCLVFYVAFFVSTSIFSQKDNTNYVLQIENIIDTKSSSYDTLQYKLNAFVDDTLKMNYLIQQSVLKNYLEGQSFGLHAKGTYYANRRIYGVADSLHNRGYELAAKSKNSVLQILHLNKLGALNKRTERVRVAIDYYQKSLEIAEKTTDSSFHFLTNFGRTKNSIGSVYLILQQYEKSIEYFNAAIQIQRKINNQHRLAVNHQNIGQALEQLGRLDEALAYYKKALTYDEAIDSDFGKIISNNSIAQIYIRQGKYKEAERLLAPLIPRIRKTQYPLHITSVILNYGWAQLELGETDLALDYLSEGLAIADKYNLQRQKVNANLLLSELAYKKGNFKSALARYKKGKEQNDKVINEQNNKYINDLTFKYDTERKNSQLLALENTNKIISLKLRQNNRLVAVVLVASLSILGLLLIMFRQRQKRKNQEIIALKREQQVKTLESLMEGEEKERLRIAQELHDGVNIDLSAIKYKLTSLLEKNNEVITEAVAMIDKSCEQVRAISHNLIPPALKDFTLVEALQDLCSTADAIHKQEVSFQSVGDTLAIDKKVEVNIFRIVQELVNNSLKHSKATEIDVQISSRSNEIQITVEDNGKGFNKELIEKKGIGLDNVQSRVDYLNGSLDFHSSEDGTSYTIEINIDTTT